MIPTVNGFTLSQASERLIKTYQKTLKTNNVLFFPHISNPYSQNKNEQKSIQAVLKEAMPMSGIMPVLR